MLRYLAKNTDLPIPKVHHADKALLIMDWQTLDENRLSAKTIHRFDKLAARLDQWIEEPDAPALLHGDMWGGNVLVKDSRITGFIDPALYFGDAEMDLAFATLFGSFREPFFEAYEELTPLRDGSGGRDAISTIYTPCWSVCACSAVITHDPSTPF